MCKACIRERDGAIRSVERSQALQGAAAKFGQRGDEGGELAGSGVGGVELSALQGTSVLELAFARGVKAAVAPVVELQDDSNVNVSDNARMDIE